MLAALAKAIGQIHDPVFRAVAWRAFGFSALAFFALLALAWWLVVSTRLFDLFWLETVVDALGWIAGLIVALLLFPAVAVTVLSFMLEDVARAVEARYYPDLPPARAQSLAEAASGAARLALLAFVLNAVALPLYFVPVLNVFVFYGLNGYLLGREYFELVAVRRLDADAVRRLWRRHRGRLCAAGVVITFLLSLPVIGWAMPTVAAAFALHLFEPLRRRDDAR